MDSAAEIERAKDYYHRGDRIMSRSILAGVVKNDPRNVQGWLLLWAVVDEADRKAYCLNRVIDIDPNNQQAIKLLNLERSAQVSTKKMNDAVNLGNIATKIGSISTTLIILGLLLPCIVVCIGTLLTNK